MKEGDPFNGMENNGHFEDGSIERVNSMYGQERRVTECNRSREVEPEGVDKEEEDTEEDKNNIVRREK